MLTDIQFYQDKYITLQITILIHITSNKQNKLKAFKTQKIQHHHFLVQILLTVTPKK